MIELACPESCSYLLEARSTASAREQQLRIKETPNPRTLILSEREMVALNAIERAIVDARRGIGMQSFRDMTDEDVLTAVNNSSKTLETQESGLIYEHRSAAASVDQLGRLIRDSVNRIGDDVPADVRPRREDLVRALSFTRDALSAHRKRDAAGAGDARSFIRYISLFYPWPEEKTKPLIV